MKRFLLNLSFFFTLFIVLHTVLFSGERDFWNWLRITGPEHAILLDGTLHVAGFSRDPKKTHLRISFEHVFRGFHTADDEGKDYLSTFNYLSFEDTETRDRWEADGIPVRKWGQMETLSQSFDGQKEFQWLSVSQTIFPADHCAVVDTKIENKSSKEKEINVWVGQRVYLNEGSVFYFEPDENVLISRGLRYEKEEKRYATALLLHQIKSNEGVVFQKFTDEPLLLLFQAGWKGVKVSPGNPQNLRYAFCASQKPEKTVKYAREALSARLEKVQTAWNKKLSFLPHPPEGVSEDAQKAWYFSLYTLLKNTQDIPRPGTLFAGFTHFREEWLWDTCLAVRGVLLYNPKAARRHLDILLEAQADDGHIPMNAGGNALTQPPLIARAVWEVYEKAMDKKWLKGVYPRLLRYQEWIEKNRLGPDGLFVVTYGPETGLDNSPVFDSLSSGMGVTVSSLHMNACYYGFLKFLAKIAKELGDENKSVVVLKKAEELKRIVQEKCWNEEKGWFFPLRRKPTDKRGFQIQVKTADSFALLWEKMVTDEQARTIIKTVEEEFYATHGVRTVSVKEKTYNPHQYWRGPSWTVINVIMAEGLMNYGRRDLAERVFELETQNMVRFGNVQELINPDTGEHGGTGPSQEVGVPSGSFMSFNAGSYLYLAKLITE